MQISIKPAHFKWYAPAAFMLTGIILALILQPHDYAPSLTVSLACIAIFAVASYFTVMAITNTESILAKTIFSLFQLVYCSLTFGAIWSVLKNVGVFAASHT